MLAVEHTFNLVFIFLLYNHSVEYPTVHAFCTQGSTINYLGGGMVRISANGFLVSKIIMTQISHAKT